MSVMEVRQILTSQITAFILSKNLFLQTDETIIRCSVIIYIQQDETLHSLFYLETVLHVSGGTSTHYQERKQLYLQHLVFVTPLLLPAAIVEELEPV
jgi:hypothetical protein